MMKTLVVPLMVLSFLVVVLALPVQAQELTFGITDEWELTAQRSYHPEKKWVSEYKKIFKMNEETRFKVRRFMMTLPYLFKDLQQTLDIKNEPGMREINPLLGSHPSDAKIVGGILASTALLYWAGMNLPEPWGSSLFDTVRYTEKKVVEQNDLVSERKARGVTIPFMIVFTTRF